MRKRTCRAAVSAATAAAAATAFALPASAEVHITPTVGVNEYWTDNYYLVGPNQPRNDETVTLGNAELALLQESERLHTRLTYDLNAVLDGPESGANYQDGRLDMGAEALRDWLFLDVSGAYGQYSVDPRVQRTPDDLFPVRNSVTDVGSGSATGSLRHDFDRVHLNASYTAGAVRYMREPDATLAQLDDSRYRDASFGLASLGTESTLSWSGDYERQRVSYDSGLEVAHDRAGLDIGVRVAPRLSLLAHGGLESDPRKIDASGGLDESSWLGGFAWQYRRGQLRLMAGRGVFGDTYDGSLTASGRIVNVDIGYQEAITTQTEQFLPHLATDSAGNVITGAGSGVLSGIDDPFGRLQPDLFQQKRLYGRVSLIGRLTEIQLAFRSENRLYLVSGISDHVRGADLTISRRLGSRSRAELSGRYDSISGQSDQRFSEQSYSLSFYRQLGLRLQLVASASRAKVSSNQPFVANWIALGLQMSFGRGTRGTPPPASPTTGVPTSGSR